MIKHSQLKKDRYRAGEVADLLGLSSMTKELHDRWEDRLCKTTYF